MIVLALETATPQVGVAIADDDGIMASLHSARGRRHAEALVPAVRVVCGEAAVEVGDIGAVAVDVGPGLFTGLRVGVATARAMAQALGVGLIGMSSLDLLAFAVGHSHKLIAAVVDARRNEVFWAPYRHSQVGVQRLSGYQVCGPDDLASDLGARGEQSLAVGDGAMRYQERLLRETQVEVGNAGTAFPTASTLAELAHPKALLGEYVAPAELVPLYLRKPDVAINWEQRRHPATTSGRR